jgi:hypothetical protein
VWEALTREDELKLINEGYLFVKWSDSKSPVGPIKNRLLNLTNSTVNDSQSAGIGKPAVFLLTKGNKPIYAVINGFLIDMAKPIPVLPNTYGY